jgi:hypothetical protein
MIARCGLAVQAWERGYCSDRSRMSVKIATFERRTTTPLCFFYRILNSMPSAWNDAQTIDPPFMTQEWQAVRLPERDVNAQRWVVLIARGIPLDRFRCPYRRPSCATNVRDDGARRKGATMVRDESAQTQPNVGQESGPSPAPPPRSIPSHRGASRPYAHWAQLRLLCTAEQVVAVGGKIPIAGLRPLVRSDGAFAASCARFAQRL